MFWLYLVSIFEIISLIIVLRCGYICFKGNIKKCCYKHTMGFYCEICQYRCFTKEDIEKINKKIKELK